MITSLRSVFSFLVLASLILGINSCQQPSTNTSEEAAVMGILETRAAELLQEYKDLGSIREKSSLPTDVDFDGIDINYTDVAPIFIQNCITCHKPDGNAPFPLTDYESIKKKAKVIKKVLEKKIMPPWMPDNDYSVFFNAPKITDSSRLKIMTWINRGCPNPGDKTVKMVHYEQELKSIPDMVLTQEKAHIVASNDDSYQCFIYDPKLTEDKYLSGIEFVSDNPEVLHHLMLYIDTANVITGDTCWDCKGDGIVDKLIPLQVWSKGIRPYRLKSHLAHKLPKVQGLFYKLITAMSIIRVGKKKQP